MLRPEDEGELRGWRTEELEERVRQLLPQYLWIDNGANERTIYCECCRGRWREKRTKARWESIYRQGREAECPKCRGRVIAKHISRGYRGIRDDLEIVFYKRGTDDRTIVAMGAYCVRELAYTEEPWNEDAVIELRNACVIRYGVGGTRYTMVRKYNGGRMVNVELSERCGCDHLAFDANRGMLGIGRSSRDRIGLCDTLEDAIAGTPFERAWDYAYIDRAEYHHKDQICVLDMIARYPAMEYMRRAGLQEFIVQIMNHDLPKKAINLRGRTKAEVLRMTNQQLGDLKSRGIRLTPRLQKVYRTCNRYGVRIKPEDALAISTKSYEADQLSNAIVLFPEKMRSRLMKYIARQVKQGIAVRDMLDYWAQCRVLGANVADEQTGMPKDFPAAHQRATERIEIQKSTVYDAQIQAQYDRLNRLYGFSFGGITLRPAADGAEVIREGEALRHCVGRYVKNYAEGRTAIFVLRRDIEPEAPWRTVEIDAKGNVVQDRGYHNDYGAGTGSMWTAAYQRMLALFWSAWAERNEGKDGKAWKTA